MNGQIRQGDVILIPVDEIPGHNRNEAREKGEGLILAAGEVTGHHHRVRDPYARIRKSMGQRYLTVSKRGATLTHEEHEPIEVPQGKYLIGGQREYVSPTPTRPASQMRVYD